MADAQHLPQGRHQAGDRHLKFHETRDNLGARRGFGKVNKFVVLEVEIARLVGVSADDRESDLVGETHVIRCPGSVLVVLILISLRVWR